MDLILGQQPAEARESAGGQQDLQRGLGDGGDASADGLDHKGSPVRRLRPWQGVCHARRVGSNNWRDTLWSQNQPSRETLRRWDEKSQLAVAGARILEVSARVRSEYERDGTNWRIRDI